MAIDDPLDVRVEQLRDALAPNLPRRLSNAVFTAISAMNQPGGLFSYAPLAVAAAAIQNLLTSRGQEIINAHIFDLVEEMVCRLKEIEQSIPDQHYFESEEFLTLLCLAFEQIQTTHDSRKLKMLADALANSASEEFVADTSKEQYMRTMRDISQQELQILHQFGPSLLPGRTDAEPYYDRPKLSHFDSEAQSGLNRLRAMGLVNENIEPHKPHLIGARSQTEVQRQFTNFVLEPRPPSLSYQITTFGERFLLFVSDAVSPKV